MSHREYRTHPKDYHRDRGDFNRDRDRDRPPRQNQNNRNDRSRPRNRPWNRSSEFQNRYNHNQRNKYYNRSQRRQNHWTNPTVGYNHGRPLIPQVHEQLRNALAQSILENLQINDFVQPADSDSTQNCEENTNSITTNEGSKLVEQTTNSLLQSLFQIENDAIDENCTELENDELFEGSNNLEALITSTIVKNICGKSRNAIEEKYVPEVAGCAVNSAESNQETDRAEDGTVNILSLQQIKCEKNVPNISLVPLSFLIEPRPEIGEHSDTELHINETENGIIEDNAVKNTTSAAANFGFKKPELISKKLVNQVATMDKTNIRHVINNPMSKFDVALKMHAKKRLREEIRKQLRNMNFETGKMTEENILQPDEYIDTANIPGEMLDKFKTVFGFNFSTNCDDIQQPNDRLQAPYNDEISARRIETDQLDRDQSKSQNENQDKNQQPRVDLMTKLKNFENIKQQASLKRSRQIEDDDVCIIENPKESVTILHDDSSTDSSTTNTSASSIQHTKLQEKFLDSFKKIVLPNMPEKERREFEKKMEKGQELSNIYNMCLDKLNDQKSQENRSKIHNFNDNNSEEALNFLVQNIHDLFKQQQNEGEKSSTSESRSKPDKPSIEESPRPSTKENVRNDQRKSRFDERNRKEKEAISNAKTASNRDGSSKSKSSSKNTKPEKQKECNKDVESNSSKDKSHSSSGKSSYKSSRNNKSPVNKKDKCSPRSSSGANGREPKNQSNNSSFIDLVSPVKSSQIEKVPENPSHSTPLNERSWRSPGEKKCLQLSPKRIQPLPPTTPSPISIIQSPPSVDTAPKTDVAATYTELKSYIGDNYVNPSEVFQITSLIEQNKISSAVLNELKEIDSKLMNLNKKKMDIEKSIIQLQKEKMEIDLSTMQLQSDRFAIISSTFSNPSTYLSANTTPSRLPNHNENTINEYYTINNFAGKIENNCEANVRGGKRKHAKTTPVKKTTNFSEKLKNRKKRCQRDILIEDAAKTLFTKDDKRCEEIRTASASEVQDIFTIRTKRNQKSTSPVKESANLMTKSNASVACNSADENLLPVSCVGNSINIIDCDSSDSEEANQNHLPIKNVSNGILKGFRLPIVQIIAVEGSILCASEDGNIYKFDSSTRQVISTFSKHTESITEMVIDGNSCIYSTSLDGYMKKTAVENFGLELQSVNLHEPLQAINLSWNMAFIGSRWGNIFTYDTKRNKLNEALLCSVGSAITALKATKEGPRKILIIASKGEQINFRDASSGLLLRTISVPDNNNIYSLLFNGGLLYCGSSTNKVYTYDFTTGNEINTFLCGNGAISIKLFKNKFLVVACYDGFIYVLEKFSGQQIGRFPGSGRMILALEIIGEKLITSAKDNSLEIIDIPKYILALIK